MSKHKYPKTRRSPSKHMVKSHIRYGRPVRSFTRGSGIRSQNPQRSKLVGKPFDEDTRMEELAFTVNFKYSDKPKDGESVIIIADTYQKALEEAFEERIDPRMPIEIDMVDPDLDAILKFVGESAKKTRVGIEKAAKRAEPYVLKAVQKTSETARLGAKYAIRGGHLAKQATVAGIKGVFRGVAVALKESSKMALYEIERSKVRRLIKQAYSKDPIERKTARIALKRVYPDIYDICSFSKDRPLSRKKAPKVVRLPVRYVNKKDWR